jgi:molybdopterin molybdotransferase
MTLTFEQALQTVRERITGNFPLPPTERVSLEDSHGRILAEDVTADRDYPPFHRSTRDGYAVRSSDVREVPASLRYVGELAAGRAFPDTVKPGQCVQIMTGAPLPGGADAVAMSEYTRADGELIEIQRSVSAGENLVPQGSEAAAGAVVLPRGRRLGPGELGLLASVGKAGVSVYDKPAVAILPTGDELVDVSQTPQWFQIRNSNAVALAAQVQAAGGLPRHVGIAPDNRETLRDLVLKGLEYDLLLLSGGVSAGKYDLVEPVLEELGAEFWFRSVAIRPGKPLVFGKVRGKPFFGLPGNPVSTFVTFEIFVRQTISALGGGELPQVLFLRARLAKPFRQRHGLTAFMPARVAPEGAEPAVELVGWQGSGDLVGTATANCFLVVHPEQTDLAAGDWVDVLLRNG